MAYGPIRHILHRQREDYLTAGGYLLTFPCTLNRARKVWTVFATVRLGFSDFKYRIIALFVSVSDMVSWICMDLVHRHGHGGEQYTVRSAYIPLLALQLLFSL